MKVIFLDIDGVLQPYRASDRSNHDLVALREKLSEKYNKDYSIYHRADVGACYYDWDKKAVERIKKIIKETGAKIVVSSDWRSNELVDKTKDLLRIWDLDQYWVGDTGYARDDGKILMPETYNYVVSKTNDKYWSYREIEILDYVTKHTEITNYVAIDDMDLSDILGEHFVITDNLINDEQADKCIKILNDKNLEIKRE